MIPATTSVGQLVGLMYIIGAVALAGGITISALVVFRFEMVQRSRLGLIDTIGIGATIILLTIVFSLPPIPSLLPSLSTMIAFAIPLAVCRGVIRQLIARGVE